MSELLLEKPILNSPYEMSVRHWEFDSSGQANPQISETRFRPEFITPIPKPRKHKSRVKKETLFSDEGLG
jgi:type III restriction enzyme